MSYFDRQQTITHNKAIETAKRYFSEKQKYAILETETTGLKPTDVVIWLTIMDLDGKLLLDHLLKLPPRQRMNPEAERIHGIDRSMLKKEGVDFETILSELEEILTSRTMLIYKDDFHERLLEQTFDKHDLTPIPFRSECIQMLENDFSNKLYSALKNRDNTGEGDCLAVLATLKRIAGAEPLPVPAEEPPITYSFSKKKEKKEYGCWAIGLMVMCVFLGLLTFAAQAYYGVYFFLTCLAVVIWVGRG